MHYQKLLENTIGILIESFHFYGCLMQRCTISWTDKIPTAGVRVLPNSSIEMVINPEFFCMLTEKERVGLVLHEMLHLVNDHMSRSFGLDGNLANIAMDTAINQYIPVTFLPPGALLPRTVVAEENNQRKLKGEKEIELPNFEAFEIYYNIIQKEMPKKAEQFQNPHQFSGQLDEPQLTPQQQQAMKDAIKKTLKELLDEENKLEEEKQSLLTSKSVLTADEKNQLKEIAKVQSELVTTQKEISGLLSKINDDELFNLNQEIEAKLDTSKNTLEKDAV